MGGPQQSISASWNSGEHLPSCDALQTTADRLDFSRYSYGTQQVESLDISMKHYELKKITNYKV